MPWADTVFEDWDDCVWQDWSDCEWDKFRIGYQDAKRRIPDNIMRAMCRTQWKVGEHKEANAS